MDFDVTMWSAEEVAEWMKGLDETSVVPHIPAFMNSGVTGVRLLGISYRELEEMGVTKVGHQEQILEAVDLLCSLQASFQIDNGGQLIQSVLNSSEHMIRLLTAKNESDTDVAAGIDANGDGDGEYAALDREAQLTSAATTMLTCVKKLVIHLDRNPAPYARDYRSVRQSLLQAVLSVSSSEYQGSKGNVAHLCETSQQLCSLSQDLFGSYEAELPKLRTATLTPRGGKGLGFSIKATFEGSLLVSKIIPNSPADLSNTIVAGDELIQVNGQTIVGWHLAKVVAALKQHRFSVSLSLKHARGCEDEASSSGRESPPKPFFRRYSITSTSSAGSQTSVDAIETVVVYTEESVIEQTKLEPECYTTSVVSEVNGETVDTEETEKEAEEKEDTLESPIQVTAATEKPLDVRVISRLASPGVSSVASSLTSTPRGSPRVGRPVIRFPPPPSSPHPDSDSDDMDGDSKGMMFREVPKVLVGTGSEETSDGQMNAEKKEAVTEASEKEEVVQEQPGDSEAMPTDNERRTNAENDMKEKEPESKGHEKKDIEEQKQEKNEELATTSVRAPLSLSEEKGTGRKLMKKSASLPKDVSSSSIGGGYSTRIIGGVVTRFPISEIKEVKESRKKSSEKKPDVIIEADTLAPPERQKRGWSFKFSLKKSKKKKEKSKWKGVGSQDSSKTGSASLPSSRSAEFICGARQIKKNAGHERNVSSPAYFVPSSSLPLSSPEELIEEDEVAKQQDVELTKKAERAKSVKKNETETTPHHSPVRRTLSDDEHGSKSGSRSLQMMSHRGAAYSAVSEVEVQGKKVKEVTISSPAEKTFPEAPSGEVPTDVPCMNIKDPDCEGWLYKIGGTGITPRNWRHRWFVMKGPTLYYYKTSFDMSALGIVYLSGYKIELCPEVKKPFAFKAVKDGAKSCYYYADTEADMIKWMKHMNIAASSSQQLDTPVGNGTFEKDSAET
eukprot:m.20684 g.20684  ORF g.20684 m.20684 type:complete len:956 (+) comp28062_c0_seq2:96-2963(+)